MINQNNYVFVALILLSSTAAAHPGALNAEGCHTVKKTGEYHCHPERVTEDKTSQASESLGFIDRVKALTLPALITGRGASSTTNNTGGNKSSGILKLNYSGFSLWIDCAERAPVRFMYNVQHDTGNVKRKDDFSLDPDFPAECQQSSAAAYGAGYDRGHQVPANHMDYSELSITQTNYMTNILPQAKNMNRGAWYQTELITECYRDIDELLIVGGVIWGNNTENDLFVRSHGVRTPDAFWKVIIRGVGQDERAIAWIVPNDQSAVINNLDKYLVSVDDIERATNETIPVADYAKHDKPAQSWLIPQGCNKG